MKTGLFTPMLKVNPARRKAYDNMGANSMNTTRTRQPDVVAIRTATRRIERHNGAVVHSAIEQEGSAVDLYELGPRPICDSQNRRWYFVERLDGSIYIYYTKPNSVCHFIVWDEKDFPTPPKMRLPTVMSQNEIPIFNRQAEEDI